MSPIVIVIGVCENFKYLPKENDCRSPNSRWRQIIPYALNQNSHLGIVFLLAVHLTKLTSHQYALFGRHKRFLRARSFIRRIFLKPKKKYL